MALYWPALHGPLFLDDLPTLSPVLDWLEQRRTTYSVILGNHTGPLGRPVTMATFLINASLFGDSVFWLKSINWLIHFFNGALLWLLFRKLCSLHTPVASRHIPAAAASIWLLLPIHVSTVAYVVQRMTLLSATFALAALLCFATGLSALSQGRVNRGRLLCLILTPALTVMAALAKENGLLVPLLCLPLAWLWRQNTHRTRPEPAVFFIIFLGLPALAAMALALFEPARIGLNGYLLRDFSMTERLLTQPRALLDYTASVFLPTDRTVSLFTDAYETSRGLLNPPSTALACLFWLTLTTAAALVSRRRPFIAVGIAIFLIGHSLESSFLSLELYFAHRNYLPSAGLVLAATDTVAWILSIPGASMTLRRCSWAFFAGLLLLESLTTARFSRTFSSVETMAAAGRAAYPQSSRAALAYSTVAMERGEQEAALHELDRLAGVDNTESRQVGSVAYLATACLTGLPTTSEQWERAGQSATGTITRHTASAFELLFRSIQQAGCGEEFRTSAGRLAEKYINASNQPESVTTRQQLRLIAGNLLVDTNHTDEGLAHLEIAFDAGGSAANVGVSLVASLLAAQRFDDAKSKLSELKQRTDPQDSNTLDFIERASSMISAHESEQGRQ
ncbi:MAG: hypothetical protein H7A20_09595 [Rhodanobacteraceae bacterium]|nr:hypothetical protein [Rhodanobacteraceae bacterium]